MRRLLFSSLITLLVSGLPAMATPRVVTDIPPVHSLVANVMGELGTPTLLIDGAGDPHHLQLRPSQARALATADIVFWVGPELTPWLEKGLATLAGDAQAVSLLHSTDTLTRPYFDAPASLDPHAWLDPQNALVWLGRIAGTLSRADPDNRYIYQQNAARTALEIAALQKEIQRSLDRFSGEFLVFSHDGFGHFTDRFGLQTAGVLNKGEATSPGAAHLRKMSELFGTTDIACLFTEPGQSTDFVRNFANKFSVSTAELDPVGTGIEPGKALYGLLINGIQAGISGCIDPN